MREQSIRTRLTLWYGVVLSIGLVLFSFSIWLLLKHVLYRDVASNLTSQMAGFEEYLHIEDGGSSMHVAREIGEFSQSLMLDHLLVVSDSRRKVVYSSPPAGDIEKLIKGEGSAKPYKLKWKRRRYLAVNRTVRLRAGEVNVLLAITSQPMEKTIDLLGWVLVLTTPVFILFAVGGGYVLSGKALLPVAKITERARTIGVGNLSERLIVPKTKDELQRLTETWNGMLERLEVAVSRISRFTADASHELRTPVAVIRFAAESCLRRTRTEPEYRAALEKIQRESERMTRLIEDLLFLARADVDKDPRPPDSFELRELVQETSSDFLPIAVAKGVALEQELEAETLSILGNAADLRRVLFILLDNAVKYTPSGGTITVRLKQIGEEALIHVEDTGIGIPKEAQAHVFERFFRVDPSRSKESGGLGLGLAIAEAIVEQHQASIGVESGVDGGSVFVVRVPVWRGAAGGDRLESLETVPHRY